jgi:hypothetical protein
MHQLNVYATSCKGEQDHSSPATRCGCWGGGGEKGDKEGKKKEQRSRLPGTPAQRCRRTRRGSSASAAAGAQHVAPHSPAPWPTAWLRFSVFFFIVTEWRTKSLYTGACQRMAAVCRRLKTRRSVESVLVLRGGKSVGARTALPRTGQGKPAQKHGAFPTDADEFRANIRRASFAVLFCALLLLALSLAAAGWHRGGVVADD